jgi:hypothetical protein
MTLGSARLLIAMTGGEDVEKEYRDRRLDLRYSARLNQLERLSRKKDR